MRKIWGSRLLHSGLSAGGRDLYCSNFIGLSHDIDKITVLTTTSIHNNRTYCPITPLEIPVRIALRIPLKSPLRNPYFLNPMMLQVVERVPPKKKKQKLQIERRQSVRLGFKAKGSMGASDEGFMLAHSC